MFIANVCTCTYYDLSNSTRAAVVMFPVGAVAKLLDDEINSNAYVPGWRISLICKRVHWSLTATITLLVFNFPTTVMVEREKKTLSRLTVITTAACEEKVWILFVLVLRFTYVYCNAIFVHICVHVMYYETICRARRKKNQYPPLRGSVANLSLQSKKTKRFMYSPFFFGERYGYIYYTFRADVVHTWKIVALLCACHSNAKHLFTLSWKVWM